MIGRARHRSRRRLGLAAALAVASAACGDAGEVGGRPGGGTIGGQTEPECGALKQVCLAVGIDAPLALGGGMELIVDFRIAGSAGDSVALDVADPEVLGIDGTRLEADGPGMSALLFTDSQGRVLDFLHVTVATPDELRILAYSRNGDLLGPVLDHVTLLVGDEVLVSVEPYRAAQPLLGSFTLQREIEGAGVTMIPDAVGGLYRVIARTPGTSTVTVRALGLERTWTLEVLP
ncbi:MAG: hypothetical protein IT385_20930 [Deltaproteobacteria bacterium]|nr:hypothetical protein [Deltaproteobacteria bacterium]